MRFRPTDSAKVSPVIPEPSMIRFATGQAHHRIPTLRVRDRLYGSPRPFGYGAGTWYAIATGQAVYGGSSNSTTALFTSCTLHLSHRNGWFVIGNRSPIIDKFHVSRIVRCSTFSPSRLPSRAPLPATTCPVHCLPRTQRVGEVSGWLVIRTRFGSATMASDFGVRLRRETSA